LQKRFSKTEMTVPIQLVIAKHNAPSTRMDERPALDANESTGDFNEGDVALFLGRSNFGALAAVTDVSPAGLGVSLHPVPLDTGLSRRILKGVGQRYMASGEMARKLGVNPKVIGCLTGAVWVQENAKASRGDRVDIGLNLKHNGKMLCVAGYCRPTQGDKQGWEYSQDALRVLQEYKRAHHWVFAAVDAVDDMRDGINLEDFMADTPEAGRLAALKGVKAWLKAHLKSRRRTRFEHS
jgi:5'-3' exoribonuclease 1